MAGAGLRKIGRKNLLLYMTNFIIFAPNLNGRLTEWLGSGLQNRLRRFESATDLFSNIKPADYQRVLLLLVAYLVAKLKLVS